jgi:hypothetical protein
MSGLISSLTGEQAYEVVVRLAKQGGAVAEAVMAAAKGVLNAVDVDEIAEDVFDALDGIEVEECWDRAGASRDGYTSPDEAAYELVEEALEPFAEQIRQYRKLKMLERERESCQGVVLGAYRYEQESTSAFKDWCQEAHLSCAGNLLDAWRKRTADPSAKAAMDEFIRQRCPGWERELSR